MPELGKETNEESKKSIIPQHGSQDINETVDDKIQPPLDNAGARHDASTSTPAAPRTVNFSAIKATLIPSIFRSAYSTKRSDDATKSSPSDRTDVQGTKNDKAQRNQAEASANRVMLKTSDGALPPAAASLASQAHHTKSPKTIGAQQDSLLPAKRSLAEIDDGEQDRFGMNLFCEEETSLEEAGLRNQPKLLGSNSEKSRLAVQGERSANGSKELTSTPYKNLTGNSIESLEPSHKAPQSEKRSKIDSTTMNDCTGRVASRKDISSIGCGEEVKRPLGNAPSTAGPNVKADVQISKKEKNPANAPAHIAMSESLGRIASPATSLVAPKRKVEAQQPHHTKSRKTIGSQQDSLLPAKRSLAGNVHDEQKVGTVEEVETSHGNASEKDLSTGQGARSTSRPKGLQTPTTIINLSKNSAEIEKSFVPSHRAPQSSKRSKIDEPKLFSSKSAKSRLQITQSRSDGGPKDFNQAAMHDNQASQDAKGQYPVDDLIDVMLADVTVPGNTDSNEVSRVGLRTSGSADRPLTMKKTKRSDINLSGRLETVQKLEASPKPVRSGNKGKPIILNAGKSNDSTTREPCAECEPRSKVQSTWLPTDFHENRPGFAQQNLTEMIHATGNWYAIRHGQRKRMRTRFLPILFNALSVSAIARWAAHGGSSREQSKQPTIDTRYRICISCKRIGHYEAECPKLSKEAVVQLAVECSNEPLAVSSCRSIDDSKLYDVVVETCEGYLIEQRATEEIERNRFGEGNDVVTRSSKSFSLVEVDGFGIRAAKTITGLKDHGIPLREKQRAFASPSASTFSVHDIVVWEPAFDDQFDNDRFPGSVCVGVIQEFSEDMEMALVKVMRALPPSCEPAIPAEIRKLLPGNDSEQWIPLQTLYLNSEQWTSG